MQRHARHILLLAILTLSGVVSVFAEEVVYQPGNESIRPEYLTAGVLYFGNSNMEPKDNSLNYEGINMGIEWQTFDKPVYPQLGLRYHSWSTTSKGVKSEIMMPTVSYGLSFNIFGLPSIVRALDRVLPMNFKLLAGAGASLNYMPFVEKLTPEPNPKPQGYGEWKWDQGGWSYKAFAGILFDRSLGGVIEYQAYSPILGERQFSFKDFRIGFMYNL